MNIPFKEFILVLIVLFILSLIQVSFPALSVLGVRPNLVLVFIFLLLFFERSSKKLFSLSYFGAITGGLFLDIFSSFPLGGRSLLFFALILVIEKALDFLTTRNVMVFTSLIVLFLLLYNLVLHLLISNEFSLNSLLVKITYNSTLALICFIIFKIIRSKRERV